MIVDRTSLEGTRAALRRGPAGGAAASHPAHAVVVGAPRDLAAPAPPGEPTAPLILQTANTQFVEATFEALRGDAGRAALRAQVAAARDRHDVLKLFQPIQRQFHVALLEAWCDAPGTPRIDPARIDSAGLVVRRVRQGGAFHEGWMKQGGRVQGWARVDRLGGPTADPQPMRRLAHLPPGTAAMAPSVDRALKLQALARDDALLEESTTPLFLAPPDVCRDAGRSVFLGVVPTASSEIAALPAPDEETFGTGFGPDAADFIGHLVGPLRGLADTFALPGRTVLPQWFDVVETSPTVPPQNWAARPQDLTGDGLPDALLPDADYEALKDPHPPDRSKSGFLGMRRFILLLRQLSSEFDAFGDGAESREVLARLAAIRLPLLRRPEDSAERSVDAATFLRQASAVLLEHDRAAPRPEMIAAWPELPPADAAALRRALSAALRARFAAVKGAPGRYDEPGARYVLRAFVRLKADAGGCARTVWSAPSEPFVIAPWYEGAGAPPVQIALPDPTREFLKSLKPNVSFVVPPSLQALLSGNPKDLADGKGSTKTNLTLGWICSFNIPVITLCAFIVLNIFLSLFDLFLHWMFFVKVCIPFPKRSDGE